MRCIVLVLLLAACSALSPRAQIKEKEEKSNADKPKQAETPKPQPTLPSNGQIQKNNSKPQEENRKDAAEERIRRVEVVSQPFDWAAVAAVVVAVLSMIFVWQQVRVMRNSERAWMTGDPEFNIFTKPPDPAGCILYPASFRNCGRSPARISEAGLSLKKALGSLTNIPKNPSYEKREIILVNRLLVPNDLFALTAPPTPLSVEEYQSLRERKLFLYAHGFVKYRDIFGKKRETRFCHYYRIPEAGGALVEGFSTFIDAPRNYNKAT
jgi:hypothetical protein